MKFRKTAALLAGLLLCAGTLGACSTGRVEETVAETTISLRNDGHEVKLALAQVDAGGERAAVLREIADKYEADFPNTEIEIRSYDTQEELEAAQKSEPADLVEVNGGDLLSKVQRGELLDLYEYLKAWDESATLTPEARQAAGALGAEHAYLIPYDFSQKLMFYRADWFGEFNEGKKEADMAWCRSWEQILKTAGQLGERGRLALAGGETGLVDYFDAVIWSTIGLGRVADPAAAYFTAKEESESIFSLELTAGGADKFREVVETVVLPESLDWTEEQAVEAFVQGKAGMLLADRDTAKILKESMPEGSWDTEGPPRGLVGAAVFADESYGWGISSSAKEQETAAHFLTFLSNADNNTHFAKELGTLPIHLEARDMEEALNEGERAQEMEMISKGDWYQYASEPLMYEAHKGYREQADRMLRQFLSGELSRDELLEHLDEYWKQAYADEGNLWK